MALLNFILASLNIYIYSYNGSWYNLIIGCILAFFGFLQIRKEN